MLAASRVSQANALTKSSVARRTTTNAHRRHLQKTRHSDTLFCHPVDSGKALSTDLEVYAVSCNNYF